MSDHQWENRWGVMWGFENLKPDADGAIHFARQTPDYYLVTDRFGNNPGSDNVRCSSHEEAEALAAEYNRFEREGPRPPEAPECEERRARWKSLATSQWSALRRLGCFGGPPPLDHPFKRFLVVVSFEDASDVSDYTLECDTLQEAQGEYRATHIYDLDTGDHYEVEWKQEARLVA